MKNMYKISGFPCRNLLNKTLAITAFMGFSFATVQAQEEFIPLSISSGFNEDVIAEDAPADDFTTTSVDGTSSTANYAFMSIDYPEASVGLPTNRILNSEDTEGLQFKLANYNEENSLKLIESDDSGTLEFYTPQAVEEIYILGTSGSGDSYFTGTIYFTDNTTQEITTLHFPDWYENSASVGVAISGIGRVSRESGSVDNNSSDPKIFQINIQIDEDNQGKEIESIEITKDASGDGILNIFGVSAAIIPDCPKPTELTADNITDQGADISWESTGEEEEWALIYGEAGFTPENEEGSTLADLTEKNATLSDLTQNTTYDVYVQANCSDTEESSLTGPLTFTTSCAYASIPFTQDFESITPPSLPNCSTIETLNEGGDWETTNDAFGMSEGFSGNVLFHAYSSFYSIDSWYFTQGIELEADVDYEISFKYANNSTSYTEKLKVAYGTSAEAEAMENEIIDLTDISDAQIHNGKYIFSVDTDGAYYFGFWAHSEENQYYLFLDDISVHIAPTCINPTEVTVDNITYESADISWTPGGDEEEWEIAYGLPGFDPEDEGEIETAQNTPEKTITGLTQNASYEVYVRSICSDSDQSSWEGPLTFTTSCGITNLPFTQDFEEVTVPSLPECSSLETNSGNSWKTGGYATGFDGNVLNYSYNLSEDADTWYFTQGINLEAGVNYQISYKYGNSTTWAEKLKVAFGSAAESSAMDNELADHTEILSTETNLVYFTVDTDDVYYFGFQAHSDANQNQLYLDDILIEVAPNCLPVTTFSLDNITADSVDLIWEAGESETSWEIAYGEPGFDPETEGESITVDDDMETTLTDLGSGTYYEIYIRANCSDDDQSDWSSEPLSFHTLCEATTLPFTQDFDNIDAGTFPACATIENTGSGNDWNVYDPTSGFITAVGFEGNVLSYQYNLNNPANAWYFTQGIELESGVNYEISYKYGNGSGSAATEKLKITYGDAPTSNDVLETLADHPEISGIDSETNTVVFTVENDGIYYFGFNAYSDTNEYYLFLDDISIQVGPTCPKPTDLEVNYITDQSATVSWSSVNESASWAIKYGEEGFDPETEGSLIEVTNGTSEVEITDLSAETAYEVYIQSICDENDESEWSDAVSFTTNVTPPENTYLCSAFELMPNDGCSEGPYTNVDAFEEANEPIGSCLNNFHGTQSVWFSFVATNQNATITTDFSSTDFTTEISVFEAPEDCADLTSLGAEVGCVTNGDDAQLTEIVIGNTYFVKVTGFNDTEGEFCIEVQMEEASCEAPTNLEISEVTDNSAHITWTAANTGDSTWEVAYGESGFDPATTGTHIDVSDTPEVILTDLTEETAYDIYVRTICSEDDTSNWTAPETFNTTLDIDTALFEDFSFYPNPVQDQLNLKANTPIENISIYNLLGQEVIVTQPNDLSTSLHTESIQAGVYLMKVSLAGNTKIFRLIKK